MRVRRGAAALLVAAITAACALPGSGREEPSTEDGDPGGEPSEVATGAATETAIEDASEEPTEEPTERLFAIFADRFPSNLTHWPTGRGGDTKGISTFSRIKDDAYVVTLKVERPANGGFYRSLAPASNYATYEQDDVEVEATARKAGVPGYFGVLCFQREDDWGGYEFAVDSDGWVAIMKRYEDASSEVLARDTVPEFVHPRGGNTIAARCTARGDRVDLALFLNGTEVLRTADGGRPLYEDGPPGVTVGVTKRGTVEAAFDDFGVRADER